MNGPKNRKKACTDGVTNFVTKNFSVTKICTLFAFFELKVRKGQTFVTKKCNIVTILKPDLSHKKPRKIKGFSTFCDKNTILNPINI